MKRKIGIYGGTFDPITFLHLQVMLRAKEELELDKVIIEPVSDTYTFKNSITKYTHRVNMIKKALEYLDDKDIELGMYEINSFVQPSTAQTLAYYRSIYEDKDADIYFICGSDLLEQLHEWNNIEDILTYYQIICIQRTQENVYKDIILRNPLLTKYRKRISIIYENVVNDISSTCVRNLVRGNMSIACLTPKTVEDYVKEFGLYK